MAGKIAGYGRTFNSCGIIRNGNTQRQQKNLVCRRLSLSDEVRMNSISRIPGKGCSRFMRLRVWSGFPIELTYEPDPGLD